MRRVANATFVATNRTVAHRSSRPTDARRRPAQGGQRNEDVRQTAVAARRRAASRSAAARARAGHELEGHQDTAAPAVQDPAQPKRIQLANGMVIFLQEDHELPLISGIAQHPRRLDARSRPAKVGLADIYGERLADRRHGDARPATSSTTSSRPARRTVETGGDERLDVRSAGLLKDDFDDVFADLRSTCSAEPGVPPGQDRPREERR